MQQKIQVFKEPQTLQEAVVEYCRRRGYVMMMCPCKNTHFESVLGVRGDLVPVYNSKHEEIWEVIKCPLVVLVRVKGRCRPRNRYIFGQIHYK